ncbi:MAG: hypothetical protein R3C32_14745 [Chloroflexota bacterium]
MYTAATVGSGILAAWYLFVSPDTWVVRACAATEGTHGPMTRVLTLG